MKKIYLLLIAALVALSLCACDTTPPDISTETTPGGVDTTPTPDTSLPEDTSADVSNNDIFIVANGKANFAVVRADKASSAEISAARKVWEAIKSATGATPTFKTDAVTWSQPHDPEALEILVGITSHDESTKVLSELDYGDYIIRFEGKKLVVTSYSEEGLVRAAASLSTYITEHGSEGTLAISADHNVTGTALSMLNGLPYYTGGKANMVTDCGNKNYMIYVSETTPEAYSEYCASLESAGYSLYTTHEAAGNKFATYTNAEYTVNAYFTDYSDSVRVVVEPLSTLPVRQQDVKDSSALKYEPAVRMVGIEYDYGGDELMQNGMLYIFRLPDGKLIVFDGGGKHNYIPDLLMQNLREMSPDPNNIVIAAWVLTHAHSDHTGGFVVFADKYASSVKVETIIHNFSTTAQYSAISDSGLYSKAMDTMKKYAGAKIIKAHSGQVFCYGGAEMEVLYTVEDLYPKALDAGNSASLIVRMYMGGQKVLMLADSYITSSDILCDMYGSYIKSDIVQVSHHGAVGGTVELYTLIDARTALQPIGQGHRYKFLKNPEIICVTGLAKDYFVAGSDVVTLTLPYTPVGNNPDYTGS